MPTLQDIIRIHALLGDRWDELNKQRNYWYRHGDKTKELEAYNKQHQVWLILKDIDDRYNLFELYLDGHEE